MIFCEGPGVQKRDSEYYIKIAFSSLDFKSPIMLCISNLIASCFNIVGKLSQSDFIYLLIHQGSGIVVLRFQNYPEVLPK